MEQLRSSKKKSSGGKDSNLLFSYKLFRRDRQGGRGGGVASYVMEGLECVAHLAIAQLAMAQLRAAG